MKKQLYVILCLLILLCTITGCKKTTLESANSDISAAGESIEEDAQGSEEIDSQGESISQETADDASSSDADISYEIGTAKTGDVQFSYNVLDDGTAEIYSYRADPVPDTVTIPSEIEGIQVTEISELFKSESTVKKVIIPDTVKRIGNETFMFAESIEEIEIQGVVEELGARAIFGCNSLKSIAFSEGLTYVGEAGIMACESMVEIHLPASLDADFDSTIGFRSFASNVVVYTPAESPTDIYARSIGMIVVNE